MRLIIPLMAVFVVVLVADIKTDRTQRDEMESLHQELTERKAQIEILNEQVGRLQALLDDAFGRPVDGAIYKTNVIATAYTARKEECDEQPWITASGTPSRVGGLAVSRDLEAIGIELGDMVVIKGMGLFKVEDRMNSRWKKRVDILHANLEAARRFAKREVEIIWVGKS